MKTNAKGIVAAAIVCALTAGSLAGVALANPIIKIEDTIENSVSDWHRKDNSYGGEGDILLDNGAMGGEGNLDGSYGGEG